MDFFERHYKKIAVGWLLLLFLFWLVPRVVSVNHSMLDPGQAGFMYLILFGIAISAFALVAFIEIASSKNYKRVKKLFFVIVVPLMLLATVGIYRSLWDKVVPKPFQDVEEAEHKGVFYAEYEVSPIVVTIDDTTAIQFGVAVGQFKREIDRFRLFDFPKYIKTDRKQIVLNCSVNNSSINQGDLFWHSNEAYYIWGPIRYGKNGKTFVEVPLKENASDTILITLKMHKTDELIDTIRLVKR